ncbi:MAG: hypothetical protein U0872_08915 [Planctomycetaceae bacterium]
MSIQTPDPPQPVRHSRLAFWRWTWRSQMVSIAVCLLVYLLSGPPVEYLVMTSNDPRPYILGLNLTYAPANWCAGNSTILAAVWSWEKSTLRAWFGSPYQRRASQRGVSATHSESPPGRR